MMLLYFVNFVNFVFTRLSSFLINQRYCFIVFFLKFLSIVFDLLTLPFYFFIDKPWKNKINSSSQIINKHYQPNGDYYYWKTKKEDLNLSSKQSRLYKLMEEVNHLSEFLSIADHLHQNSICAGKRNLLNKIIDNGKIKYELSDYEWFTYEQVLDKINSLVKVFHHKFKLKKGDRVAIMSDTCLEWLITFFALQFLGCELVTLHISLDDESICYILNSTKSEYLFTQDDLVKTFNRLKPKIQTATKLVNINNPFVDQLTEYEKSECKFEFFEYNDLVEDGQFLDEIDSYNQELSKDDIALILFTSGSTGMPKGVLISHANFIQNIKNYINRLSYEFNMGNDDTFLSYLPLSHIFELVCEMTFFMSGVKLAYGKAGTLTTNSPLLAKNCKGDIQTSKATIWVGVPLVFERLRNQVLTLLKDNHLESIYHYAYEYKSKWTERGFECRLIDLIFFRYIQNQFGGRLKYIITGGAPMQDQLGIFLKIFLNVKLILSYGSTECAVISISVYDRFRNGNTMALHDDLMLRLEEWEEANYSINSKPNPRGELVYASKAISVGYFENKEETDKAFFVENGIRWWRSGDIGEIDKNGQIKLIDRKKDLIKLQMGKFIALSKVEAVLKNCSYVENIAIHCNSYYNHLIAILQPNLDNLLKLARSINKSEDDLESLCENKLIKDVILKELMIFGKSNGLISKEVPVVIKISPILWTPKNNLLTASFKINRTKIYAHFKQSIDLMYKELDKKFPSKLVLT